MSYLLERDALNGKEGKGIMTLADGRNVEMFGLKKFETNGELQESDFKVVGTRLVQKKTTGVSYIGSMTIYYGTPEFLNMMVQYAKTGKIPYFTLQITNNDPTTSVGQQIVAYYNVKLSKCPISKLDANSDTLEIDVTFSFTDIEVLQAFSSTPAQLGS